MAKNNHIVKEIEDLDKERGKLDKAKKRAQYKCNHKYSNGEAALYKVNNNNTACLKCKLCGTLISMSPPNENDADATMMNIETMFDYIKIAADIKDERKREELLALTDVMLKMDKFTKSYKELFKKNSNNKHNREEKYGNHSSAHFDS